MGRIGQSRAAEERAEVIWETRKGHGRTGQDRAEQERRGQRWYERVEKEKAGQDRTEHERRGLRNDSVHWIWVYYSFVQLREFDWEQIWYDNISAV
jgi:hypothetical protein